MMRVLLDVDGVFADFTKATLDSLVELGGPKVEPHTIVDWDILSSLPPEWADPLQNLWYTPGWCSKIPLYEDSLHHIERLRDVAQVYFVTTAMHKAPHWLWERDQWLRTHLKADGRDIVFTAAKYLVRGDMLVDDKPSNVNHWALEHPNGIAVLWDQPYNRNALLEKGVLRTSSWATIREIVEQGGLRGHPNP